MALYTKLPVYKASYDLVRALFEATGKFAREYKYTVGQQLKDRGLSLVANIYRANKTRDKVLAIEAAREDLEMIRLQLRLMQDCGQIGLKAFVHLEMQVENVSRQLAGWEKHTKGGGTPPESSRAARAQTSVRSDPNNPLAMREEYRPETGALRGPITKDRATNTAVIPAAAGNRNNGSGALNNQGGNGNYWSSSVSGTNASNLNFNSSNVNPANTNNRANGLTVRCVQRSPDRRRTPDSGAELLLDLFRAYFDARKHKRSTAGALAFEENYEEKLFALHAEIMDRTYRVGRSTCFVVTHPLKREVFAADFRDRIVHHLLFNWLNPLFEPTFIRDSYSCRKGKGTSDGIARLEHFIRSCSENYAKECWVLKLDIASYFMTMDRSLVYEKIERVVRATRHPAFDADLALHLLKLVVFNDPTKGCVMNGSRNDWRGLPKSKSLFFAPAGKGFPIGNLTSQLFSNIYLNEFDHWVREELGMERYGRYVDDMVFVHADKEALKAAVQSVRVRLKRDLGLGVHPKKVYLQNVGNGVGFLGAYVKPWRTYVGSRTKRNLYARMRQWNELAAKRGKLGDDDTASFLASMSSYLGMAGQFDTFALRGRAANRLHPAIARDFEFSDGFLHLSARCERSGRTAPLARSARSTVTVS